MSQDLVNTIFQQFADILVTVSAQNCFQINQCDLNYRVRSTCNTSLIDICYVPSQPIPTTSPCCRPRNMVITINFTNICYNNLPTCKWIQYLQTLANQFMAIILGNNPIAIPTPNVIQPRKIPCWSRFPVKNTTVINQVCQQQIQTPPSQVIVQNPCPCVNICPQPCYQPQQETIIQCQPQPIITQPAACLCC